MENKIIEVIATQGVFAILFTYLLLYILKENSKRESNYQEILKQFSDLLPDIKEDLKTIKEKID